MSSVSKSLLSMLAALSLVACGGESPQEQPGDTDSGGDPVLGGNDAGDMDLGDSVPGDSHEVVEVVGYQCVRDPVLLGTRTECHDDIQCPCGSHCESGLCAFECMSDADCVGWCDFFGTCRAVADNLSVPGVRVSEAGALTVSPQLIPVYDWSEEHSIALKARWRDLPGVRARASDGLWVECRGELVRECELETVPAVGLGVTISVKVADGTSVARDSWTLALLFEDQAQVVSLRRVATPVFTPLLPGRYEGQLWVKDTTMALDTEVPFAGTLVDSNFEMMNLPFELKVFDNGVVSLSDAGGILPAGWAFQVRADGSFDATYLEEDLSARPFLGTAVAALPGDTEVTVSGKGSLRAIGDAVQGQLLMVVGGLGLSHVPSMLVDERFHVRWDLTARRIGDLPAAESPPDPFGAAGPVFSSYDDRYGQRPAWEQAVADCNCPLTGVGTTAAEQVQGYLCYNHPTNLASRALVSYTSPGDLGALGDLACQEGVELRPTIMPFFTYGDRTTALLPRELLSACIGDLGRLAQAVPQDGLSGAARLNELSGCGSDGVCTAGEMPRCIDVPPALRAMGLGLEGVERHGMPDQISWPVVDEAALRLGLRVLQQWIQVHTFVAREATQQADQYLGVDYATLTNALSVSLAGWDAVLHPQVAARLLHVPPEILSAPDYRSGVVAVMSQDITQGVGMPVIILEGLRAQLEAATQAVRRARFENRALPANIGLALRYAVVLTSMAQLLHTRTLAAGIPPWEELWKDSKYRFAQSLAQLEREMAGYRAHENPLGIADEDLPLYRGLLSPVAPGQRFAATSTFILDGIADQAVTEAIAAHGEAIGAWDLLLQRRLQADVTLSAPDRAAEIKRLYGEKILTLCGNPLGLNAENAVTGWPDLSEASCFLSPVNPACQFDEHAFMQQLTLDDVGYQLCVNARTQSRLGSKAALRDDYINGIIQSINHDMEVFLDPDQRWANQGIPGVAKGEQWWQAIDPGIVEAVVDWNECARAQENPDPAVSCKLADLFILESYTGTKTGDEQAFVDARNECQALFNPEQTLAEKIAADPALDNPDCYSGTIGELVLAARSAAKEVEAAGSALQDYTQAYEAAMWKCTIDDRTLQMTQAVTNQLDALSKQLQTYTATSNLIVAATKQIIAVGPKVVAALGKLVGGGDEEKDKDKGSDDEDSDDEDKKKDDDGGGDKKDGDLDEKMKGVSTVYDFISGQLLKAQDDYIGITLVKEKHDKFLADFNEQIQDAKCYHDAEIQLIGAETQARRVERAKLDLARAVLQIRNAKAEVTRLIAESRQRGEAEAGRQRVSLFQEVWSDLWEGSKEIYSGKVETYRRKMRLAQRMAYLAVRAVEYEMQVPASEGAALRRGVLAARNPDALDVVLDQLHAIVNAGNIAGQQADNKHVELSLKSNLLQLANRQDLTTGLNTMSDTERFRALLVSPAQAYHTDDGTYLGQLVPFSVAPMGAIGLGDPGTIPLLTGTQCAERSWHVVAALEGTNLVEDGSIYSEIDLLHKNTFYSQWCVAPGAGEDDVQVSSVRPARNLFKDPEWGGSFGTTIESDSEYVRAPVTAYHNVGWTDFQSPDYDAGYSEALACRGLYGDYALFFPAQILSIDGGPGLHLENIDDVWVRFDYVMAAKQWY